ncbi:hypothetical protein [Williamsia muralis]|uniref:Uncharacterized protein n=1 Tax=Williamsia marianensis TaxID=85044 RepID=A0ABU4F212_WILMA|nr:hypothetical protein [Williamsia muralis]MDV7137031.1 hypothetical protein [Williamsia muralis]
MSSDRGSDRSRPPAVRFAVRAAVAGAVLGCAVGLGAYNSWLVSLLVGVPLVVTALVISPRPRRIDGMLKAGQSRKQIPVTIEALTRSSLDASDVQPTLVTATISPPNDTDYRTRWLTAMPKPVAATVLQDADTTLPSALIPPRPDTSLSYDVGIAPGKATEFGNHPPKSTLLQPLITLLVAIALFVGVGDGWHISVSLPDTGFGTTADGDSDGSKRSAQERVDGMLAKIGTLDPSAATNILSLSLGRYGSDNISLLDSQTGETINLNYSESSGDWGRASRSTTPLRSGRTFRADEISRMSFTTIVDQMKAALPENVRSFESMAIARSEDDQPVLATGTFHEVGEDAPNQTASIQANTDGAVATWYQPGDFETSFTLAREAMNSFGIPTDQPIVNRFEIRGNLPSTPTVRAGDIQNSGGFLIDFTDRNVDARVVQAPGSFPQLLVTGKNTNGRLPAGSVAFRDISSATFKTVREDYMRRHGVDVFDRDAVDIQTSYEYAQDDYQTVIMIAMRPQAITDYYSAQGVFVETQ